MPSAIRVQGLPCYLTEVDYNWIYFFLFIFLICPGLGDKLKYPAVPFQFLLFPIISAVWNLQLCWAYKYSWFKTNSHDSCFWDVNYKHWPYKVSFFFFFDLFKDFLGLNASFLLLASWLLISHCHLPGITLPVLLSPAFPKHFVLGVSLYTAELGFALWANLKIFLRVECSTLKGQYICSEFYHTLLCHVSCFDFLFLFILLLPCDFLFFFLALFSSRWFFSC